MEMERSLAALLAIHGCKNVSVHWWIGGSNRESSMVICGTIKGEEAPDGIREYEILVHTEASHKPMAIARFRSEGIRSINVDADGWIKITLGA